MIMPHVTWIYLLKQRQEVTHRAPKSTEQTGTLKLCLPLGETAGKLALFYAINIVPLMKLSLFSDLLVYL